MTDDPYQWSLGVLPGTERLPFGFVTGHTWHEIGVLMRIIKEHRIERFVEIGVHEGGLAALMCARTLFVPEFEYLGVEINADLVRAVVKGYEGRAFRFIWGDALSPLLVGLVSNFAAGGRSLIYCDGGNKPAELAAYAPVIQPGNLIGSHDFQDGTRNVRDVPGYGERTDIVVPELKPADLQPVASFHNAVPALWLEETRLVIFQRPP